MTAKTSQKLADALAEVGLTDLAARAAEDEFHDFLSQHDMPDLELHGALLRLVQSGDPATVAAASAILVRHHQGEFDATLEESEAWADSDEGKAAFAKLMEGISS